MRLIDLDDLAQNQYIVTQQFIYSRRAHRAPCRFGAAGKSVCRWCLSKPRQPVKKCISWVDGAVQVHDDYEKFVPELFVCNVFSVATEGQGLPLRFYRVAGQGLGPMASGW